MEITPIDMSIRRNGEYMEESFYAEKDFVAHIPLHFNLRIRR
jgi:hypothetical protein